MISFFEAVEYAPGLRINWTEALNNIVNYRLKDGWQSFESFFAYGARYLAIHYEGDAPCELPQVRLFVRTLRDFAAGRFPLRSY